MEDEDSDETIYPKPKNIYGMRKDVQAPVFYNTSDELIYPVEGCLAVKEQNNDNWRFMRFPENTTPLIMAGTSNRKFIAILERSNDEVNLCLYDSVTLKKRRSLAAPEVIKTNGCEKVRMASDCRSVCLLSSAPDQKLFMIIFDKEGTVLEYAFPSSTRKTIETLIVNAFERNTIYAAGEKHLYIVARDEDDKILVLNGQYKIQAYVTSIICLSSDMALLGTSANEVYLFDSGDFKYKQTASDAGAYDVLWDQEAVNKEIEENIPMSMDLPIKKVSSMQTHAKGFAYAIYNKIFVFEKVSKFRYNRRAVISIPIGVLSEKSYQITMFARTMKEDTVAIVAKHAQIYIAPFVPADQNKVHFVDASVMGVLWHNDAIVSVACCAWKPLLITASMDQTVRIWNYMTNQMELIRKFQVDVHLVQLNPFGLMAAIGFTDQLRVTQILMDDLNIVKTYNFSQCRAVQYSNYGHLMAAAYDNKVSVTSVYKLNILYTMTGHNGTVMALAFSKSDDYLFSGGADGAIYQWDMVTGHRVAEIVMKGTEYTSFCCTMTDEPTLYSANQFGTIREFCKMNMVREVVVPSKAKCRLTDICMLKTDKLMFIANSLGNIFYTEVPIMEGSGSFEEFNFFVSPINRVILTYDGLYLVVISKLGTLAIFCLENIESKLKPIDNSLLKSTEVLITRQSLVEKNQQITNLTLRLKQQAEEFQYQMNLASMFDNQNLANVHKGYCQALEELRNKNNQIEMIHTDEMNNITLTINEMKQNHRKLIENLTNQYSERMLIEFQKYTKLRESMVELQEDYEEKLKTSAGQLQDTVEGLENSYKSQLDERNVLIRELMKEMQDKKVEFIEYCRGVEAEYNHNIDEMTLHYENRLTTQRNETKLWRGKYGVFNKRYEILLEEVDKFLNDMDLLKEEEIKIALSQRKMERQIVEIQREIADKEYGISAKERRIQEQLRKNQELEKLKQVLAHKISVLKSQIEPIEFEINDKRKQISDLEDDLSAINSNNVGLEAQLNELKEKFLFNVDELDRERKRAKGARHCIETLYSDIYSVTGKIHMGATLQEAVEALYRKHCDDDELRRFINTEEQVRDEFYRQRSHLENLIQNRQKQGEGDGQTDCEKLFEINNSMIKEIEKLNKESAKLRKANPYKK